MAASDFPPYSHSQPFIHQLGEDRHGEKRLISPESQGLPPYQIDKRIRHNSLEYLLDLSTQQSQPTYIRRVTLEDVMRGIENLSANTVKREDLKEIATKQDLMTLEGNVKAQATELHQLRLAYNKQQGELNLLRETVDSNCAAIMASAERTADRDLGHRMLTSNGGQHAENPNVQTSKRFNLVIEGVPDVPLMEIYAFVIELAGNVKVTLYKRDISNITRIPRRQAPSGPQSNPGPVVVTFVHAHLRDAILRKKVDLKDLEKYSTVYVNPDEPLDIRRQKARFRRIAFLARRDGHQVSYRADSIRIGDVEYKVSELSKIPKKFIPEEDPLYDKTQDQMDTAPPADRAKETTQDTETVKADNAQEKALAPKDQDVGNLQLMGRTALRGGRICFSGATSYLSNFFLVCFVFCNIQYKSLEQCYHHTHAVMAKALDIAALIYKETDGVELKNLSKRIPYCEEWAKVSDPKMDEMIDAKFSQNPELMDKLARTAPYDLVEASVDKKWGGGEPWHSAKYDTGTFTGGNKFGVKITKYRDNKLAQFNAPTVV